MTLEIQEEFGRLFSLLVPLSKEFNKKNYETVFKDQYESFRPLFTAVSTQYESAGDEEKQQVLDELAGILPGMMKELLDEQPSRRKKESILMPYNLSMVAYVIPMFRYGKTESGELFVDRMIELWNENSLDMKISKSTFDEIQSGFRSRFCYITTAVCESLGRDDDCRELTLLRNYRDEYLVNTTGGKELVEEYYNVAPTIVKRINRMENAGEIYRDIWETYLSTCVSLAEEKKLEECRRVYTDMVNSLRETWLYS